MLNISVLSGVNLPFCCHSEVVTAIFNQRHGSGKGTTLTLLLTESRFPCNNGSVLKVVVLGCCYSDSSVKVHFSLWTRYFISLNLGFTSGERNHNF